LVLFHRLLRAWKVDLPVSNATHDESGCDHGKHQLEVCIESKGDGGCKVRVGCCPNVLPEAICGRISQNAAPNIISIRQ
jgi:hypothetical protein